MKSLPFQRLHPLYALSLIFVLWKAVLILIAIGSPGNGYDTSTSLLSFSPSANPDSRPSVSSTKLSKFVRWDAIYYTHIAQHGHVFEQEWAFGNGLSTYMKALSGVLFQNLAPSLWQLTFASVLLSHLAHYGSMVLIWRISSSLCQESMALGSVPVVTALLYIFSPAGIFLSAPYAESLFALFSFLGTSIYVNANSSAGQRDLPKAVLVVLAGAAFGLAASIRSNGILAGTLYVFDAIDCCIQILSERSLTIHLLRLSAVVSGGLLIGTGFLFPQAQAYIQYCSAVPLQDRREWCNRSLPSIFTFVQSHYWNVGPFCYWTLSNLPLFLLAAPVLCLLLYSGIHFCFRPGSSLTKQYQPSPLGPRSLEWRLAIPQLILAILAITSYHVQIITRISSGYPMWYIWLAQVICRHADSDGKLKGVFRWMLLYALLQAGLYACFLPPA